MLLGGYGTRCITMGSIKIDKVILTSLFGAFINYLTSSSSLVVTATSLANGASRTISTTIPYTRGGTVADIYASSSTVKTLITGSGRAAAANVYTYTSSEVATFRIDYSASSITVSLVITNNTGGSITPVAQTLDISVVQYDAPITSI